MQAENGQSIILYQQAWTLCLQAKRFCYFDRAQGTGGKMETVSNNWRFTARGPNKMRCCRSC